MMSTALQDSPLLRLPLEVQVEIFNIVLSEEGHLGTRLICKDLLGVINEGVKRRWQLLVQTPLDGPIPLDLTFNRINKKFTVNNSYPDDFNYLKLFRALNQEWKTAGISIPKGELKMNSCHHAALQAQLYQKLVDQSLMMMWGRIWLELQPFSFHYRYAKDVRHWMVLLENDMICTSMLRMDLSDLGMRFLPIEICSFSGLEELNLSQNHIDVLPDFLENFKALRFLNLRDNDLQELPLSFPNWTHLRSVNLEENPLNSRGLRQLDQWKENVKALHEGEVSVKV